MSCLKSQGYLKSKLGIFSKSFLYVISTRHQCSHPTQKFEVLLSSCPRSLSWANIITLTFLKSVPFSIPTAVALLTLQHHLLFWTAASVFLADCITPSPPEPGKSLAALGVHYLLFSCQIFTHAFVFVQKAPVPLSPWPYFLSKAVALFFQVRFAVSLHASVFMLVISNTCCTVLLICSSFIISTQWNGTDWYLNSNPECFLSQ